MTVYMAVREEPVPYLQPNSGGASRPANDLYSLYQRIQGMQKFYLLRAVLCVLGIAYLVSTRLLRAERRKAEKKLAALTRRVPGRSGGWRPPWQSSPWCSPQDSAATLPLNSGITAGWVRP